MAWKKAIDGSLAWYEDGQEPIVFPKGSLSQEMQDSITLEMADPDAAEQRSQILAADDIGDPIAPTGNYVGPSAGPPSGQPVNKIDLNAPPPGPPSGQPVNVIDLNKPPPPPPVNQLDPKLGLDQGPGGQQLANARNAAVVRSANAADAAALPAPVTPQEQIAEAESQFPATPHKAAGPSPLSRAFGEQDAAMRGMKIAADDATEVKKARALEESGVVASLDRQISNHEAQAQIQREMLAKETAKAEQKYSEAVDSVAKMKVDPDHFWSSKSNGEKFGLLLAGTLGALGSSLLKEPNVVMQQINQRMNEDLQTQRDNIMNAKEGAALKGNIVAQMRQKGLTLEQSLTAAKQVMLEGAKRKLDTLASEYASPEADANNKAMQSQLDKQIADLHVARTMAAQKAAVAGMGKHLNEGTAKELGEANAAVKNARGLLDKFGAAHAGGIGGWLMSFVPMTDAKRYENNSKVAAQVIGSYLEGGKLTDSDYGRYQSMLPAPGDSKETAKQKTAAIVDLIAQRQGQEKEALRGSGYNVNGIADAKKNVGFRAL